jgi:N-acetylmuramoyl-L-alanine amidase
MIRHSRTPARTAKVLYVSFLVLCFNVSLAARPVLPEHHLLYGTEFGHKSTDTLPLKPTDYRIKKIVIDPGHGGHDPGCSGAHSKEKHIVLKIAQQFAEYIRQTHPDIEVILTRNSDTFIPLHERAQIANKANADLFMSIHCNFMPGSKATKGSETFVLGQHKMEENLGVALRENASILLEENYEENYDYDPNSPEGHIVLALYQNVFLDNSIRLAEKVEKYLHLEAERKSRGVKQAGFLVLRATAMPSVLIEAGFLSNQTEEEFLRSVEGQDMVAFALLMAFSEYRAEREGTPLVSTDPLRKERIHVAQKTIDNPPYNPIPVSEKTPANPELTSNPTNTPIANSQVKSATTLQICVQLLAASRPVNTKVGAWLNLPYQWSILEEGTLLKYQVRGFSSIEEALQGQYLIRQLGFPDAFLVVYKDGVRISAEEIKQLLNP